MAKLFKVLKSRTVLVGLAILIQAAWYILFLRQLTSYSVFINGFFRILSVVIVLYLIRKDENSAYGADRYPLLDYGTGRLRLYHASAGL